MTEERADVTRIKTQTITDFASHRVGEIVSIDHEGRAHVSFDGNHGVPVLARSIVDAPARAGDHAELLVGSPVLLAFENSDGNLPIILGVLRDPLQPAPVRPEVSLDVGDARDVVIDGQRLVFEAKQEVLLRCGKSTILLRKDGKVLIRGANLLSRSSGPNRIKGGTIDLN